MPNQPETGATQTHLDDLTGVTDTPTPGDTDETGVAEEFEDIEHAQCASFEVSSKYAHFRRVETTPARMTYRLMPRTTIAGMLAAICGYGRDEYYHLFGPENSRVAIVPIQPPKVWSVPVVHLSVRDDELRSDRNTAPLEYPHSEAARQRYVEETLVDPTFRIHVWLNSDEAFETITDHLVAGTSVFPPTMGQANRVDTEVTHIPETTFVRRDDLSGQVAVDSAVPVPESIVPEPGVPSAIERSPGFMRGLSADDGATGRVTTEFIDWAYPTSEGRLTVDADRSDVQLYEVGEDLVIVS